MKRCRSRAPGEGDSDLAVKMGARQVASWLVLLCFISGRTSSGAALDVCASCHVNATCDHKPNGSGKECNCRYGFVGNGLTFCLDKDECQLGARRICGPHTTCHNTFGSYYCTCLEGYSPTNNMNSFIPNDGSKCQDIDECRVEGLCGRGALCTNLEGSFECRCQLGFTVFNGREPFHPQKDLSTCREVSCGPPLMPYNSTLWSATGTSYGDAVTLVCEEGFLWRGGDNTSVCGADGHWSKPSIICEEVDCQPPAFIPNSKRLWDGTSHLNSEVHYQCEEGFVTRGLRNYSRCGADGTWEDVDLVCEEISCGPPPTPPHTNLLWDGATRPASMAMYECVTGLYHASGAAVSTCLTSGQWTDVSVVCKAKCGPVPGPAHSEVVWQNTTVAVHRCVLGFRSWRGHDTSVCSSTGVWLGATLHCVAVQPAISHLSLAGEKCLRWQAGRHGGDSEMYKVTYVGSRDFDLDFHDTGKQFLRSKSSQVQVCLNLLPVANYTVYVSAVSAKLTVAITTNTSLTVPSPPTVYYKEYETPVPTLSLRRSPDSLDSISVYQVFVLPVGDIMVFDCWSPEGPNSTWAGYITAVIQVGRVKSEYNFTVGDGRWYGGYYNTPLEEGHSYYILLRVQSRWKRAVKSSCVLWAKVKGTSYVLKLSLLCAAACVVLLSLLALGGYFHLWCVHFRL
ncbi:sushi domain-containing protein 1 isoform X5 [Synchiropus splendidus]|uniref:sushi domain-containing protein 1 isoform X5 n=1 Tax=Synchiropus splendidus TaxID=270530 RepID=UPI00237D5222|nr:sushi domain-containing protein 1 isoform X5 [Synchiropus splendidus]